MNKSILVLLKICDGEINPFDAASLEVALGIEDYDVHTLTMGPLSNKHILHELTRLEISAHLISDVALAGSDSLVTANVLSEFIKKLSPEIIFAGVKSIDGDTGQVPPMVAELLGFDLVSSIVSYDNGIFLTREGKRQTIKNRTIYVFERIANLRFPGMFSTRHNIDLVDVEDLEIDKNRVGLLASPTRVIRTHENNENKRKCEFIEIPRLIELLHNHNQARKAHKKYTGKKADLIHYVGDIKDIADDYACETKEISYISDANQFAKSIPEEAKIILFENTIQLKELAARIAAKKQYGLCADCTDFSISEQKFIMTRPACGGDVIADIVSNSPVTLASVAKNSVSNDIVFGIGCGAIPYIDEISLLAKKYSATLVATRPVIDKGYMDYPRQVGLTGKMISPKIYVAFGISGQIQHLVGVAKSDIIVAVNSNINEKVFDFANFGLALDMEHVIKEMNKC